MSNYHLRDMNLSLKAKALLSQMLSLPEDWDDCLNGLSTINMESREAIRAAVLELERAGYLQRCRERRPDGKLGSAVYTIHEMPQHVQDACRRRHRVIRRPVPQRQVFRRRKSLQRELIYNN